MSLSNLPPLNLPPPYLQPEPLLITIAANLRDDSGGLRYDDFNSFIQVDKALYTYLNPKLWEQAVGNDANTQRVPTTNNLKRFEFFLDHGVNVGLDLPGIDITGFPDEDGNYEGFRSTPLHIAADDLDKVSLARKGAKVQYFDENDHGKYSAFHAARSVEIVELLLLNHNA
jgi:hypothetical protein